MPDPTQPTEQPATPRQGWVPTTSTAVGAMVGGAASQIVVATWNSFMPAHAIDLMTAGAINTICVFVVGYLIPDGGRK